MNDYAMGLDLAKLSDYTALAVVQRVRVPETGPFDAFDEVEWDKVTFHYHIRLLERFKRETPYPDMMEHVIKMLGQKPLSKDTSLVADATGVGEPVVDYFRKAGLFPIPVTITSGEMQHVERGRWRVPKIDLLSLVSVLLQQKRLKLLETLQLAPVLMQEMLNLDARINPDTGRVSIDTWREGKHDDLVFAVALACWWGKRGEVYGSGKPRDYLTGFLQTAFHNLGRASRA